ncbi:MAG: hypothetical protein ACLGH6_09075 [Gammaproteobacteria bacterium]
MTSPARMASLQAAYDNRTDPRFDDRSDEHIDSIAVELFEELLVGEVSAIDDERVQLNLDIEAMRRALALSIKGNAEAALIVFRDAFEDACRIAANDEAASVYAARCRADEEAAAEDRAERRRGL